MDEAPRLWAIYDITVHVDNNACTPPAASGSTPPARLSERHRSVWGHLKNLSRFRPTQITKSAIPAAIIALALFTNSAGMMCIESFYLVAGVGL